MTCKGGQTRTIIVTQLVLNCTARRENAHRRHRIRGTAQQCKQQYVDTLWKWHCGKCAARAGRLHEQASHFTQQLVQQQDTGELVPIIQLEPSCMGGQRFPCGHRCPLVELLQTGAWDLDFARTQSVPEQIE